MREWNADAYHRVSNPQFEWGRAVLERLPLRGDETVLDVGCGTGRLTEQLLARLPRGRVIGLDASANMVRVASEYLRPGAERRVALVLADAASLPLREAAHAVFSTATFHWVLDHPRLFQSLFTALMPGGRLIAQCGGGPNIRRIHDRAARLQQDPAFADRFTAWTDPWNFADAATTAARLRDAGFVDVHTSVDPAPVVMPDADTFTAFITNVICRPYLPCLVDDAQRQDFVDRLTRLAAQDDPPFELDYWRLNIDARKP